MSTPLLTDLTEGRSGFRYIVGLIAILGGLAGLLGLYAFEVPVGNRDAVMLALGIVLGWGSSVINGEWGSSPAGRRVSEAGVEAARKGNESPAGTKSDPTHTEVTNKPGDPVPTTTTKGRPDAG